jgi:sterol desaturase/sphingolipid hydroxylase (fatty acid hydroxylase superfamily)
LTETLLTHALLVRLSAFAGVFAAMALWELAAPRRHEQIGRLRRWPGNVGIVMLDTLLVRVVFPTAAVGVALVAEARGSGLFHVLGAPPWFAIPASVILLDLAIYLQHVLFHAVRCCGDSTACTTRISSSTSPRVSAFTRSRSCCRW